METEVTFKIPKDYTVTHRGEKLKDGDKRKVSARRREWLAKRGLITAKPKASKPEPEAKPEES